MDIFLVPLVCLSKECILSVNFSYLAPIKSLFKDKTLITKLIKLFFIWNLQLWSSSLSPNPIFSEKLPRVQFRIPGHGSGSSPPGLLAAQDPAYHNWEQIHLVEDASLPSTYRIFKSLLSDLSCDLFLAPFLGPISGGWRTHLAVALLKYIWLFTLKFSLIWLTASAYYWGTGCLLIIIYNITLCQFQLYWLSFNIVFSLSNQLLWNHIET